MPRYKRTQGEKSYLGSIYFIGLYDGNRKTASDELLRAVQALYPAPWKGSMMENSHYRD